MWPNTCLTPAFGGGLDALCHVWLHSSVIPELGVGGVESVSLEIVGRSLATFVESASS